MTTPDNVMTPEEMARAREICAAKLPPQYDCWGMLVEEQPYEARTLLRKALRTITERDKRIEELERVVAKMARDPLTEEYSLSIYGPISKYYKCKFCGEDSNYKATFTHAADCPTQNPLVALALEHDGREGEK